MHNELVYWVLFHRRFFCCVKLCRNLLSYFLLSFTRYSSLTQLYRRDFQTIKFVRGYIQDLQTPRCESGWILIGFAIYFHIRHKKFQNSTMTFWGFVHWFPSVPRCESGWIWPGSKSRPREKPTFKTNRIRPLKIAWTRHRKSTRTRPCVKKSGPGTKVMKFILNFFFNIHISTLAYLNYGSEEISRFRIRNTHE